jgi:hypothetical protein
MCLSDSEADSQIIPGPKSGGQVSAVLAGVGLAIATGLEKQIEIAFLKAMPTWLLELTTRF